MKNHFIVLEGYARDKDYESILSYLQKTRKDIDPYERFVFIGDKAIDALINSKIYEAKQKGIIIEPEIVLSGEIFIDDYVMTSILGPLFDAALEELEEAETKILYFFMDSEKKQITSRFKHRDEVAQELRAKNKYVYRNDFAMRSVKKMAEKNDGSFHIEIVNGTVDVYVRVCFLSIVLPS